LKLNRVFPETNSIPVEERVPGKQGLKLSFRSPKSSWSFGSKSEFQENKD